MPEVFPVYVAYAPEDEVWAQHLAEALERAGLRTFVRAWDVVAGNVTVHAMDAAMRGSRAAVVVLGRSSTGIREYPGLTEQADLGALQLVPVLLEGAVVPASLSGRERVDFSRADSPAAFDARVMALVGALRGEPIARRSFAALDFERRSEGPVTARLRIGPAESVLVLPAGTEIAVRHGGLGAGLDQQIWAAGRRRVVPGPGADAAVRRLGEELGRRFLSGPVATALTSLVTDADRRNRGLRLAIETAPGSPQLADVPWECLRLPGLPAPLALHPRVRVFRGAELGPTAQPDIPGPLRILAVVAAPDHNGQQLLDYEHELSLILERVDPAFRGRAHVRVLNWGSVGAIREALIEERFHVLHVSCHAAPGVLVLETPDGEPDRVDAARFAAELILPDRTVPLVVLAGCSTALSTTDPTHRELPGFAQTLLEHGVPTVLAMTAPVTDIYATELLSLVYGEMARVGDPPDPLHVLSDARRTIESARPTRPARDPLAQLPEWPIAAFFARVRDTALFDPRTPGARRPDRAPPIRLAGGIVDLDSGEFVGRRADLRRLLRLLRGPRAPGRGVLLHGIGGVGKSSLAVQLVRMLATPDTIVVTRHGPGTADEIMASIADALRPGRLRGTALGADEARSLRGQLKDAQDDWSERLELLEDHVLAAGLDVVLLLDDPLGDPLRHESGTTADGLDPEVRRFLEAWLRIPRGTRLVATARWADALGPPPSGLHTHHLGPLSQAEAAKLYWRLPGVYALSDADRDRAYRDLGGHPRALEYLDALLQAGRERDATVTGARGGDRPFAAIADRMETVLHRRGVDDPAGWMRAAGRDVDVAIAETVTAAAADALLTGILNRLAECHPEAHRLLLAASVHRRPVPEPGLVWVVSERTEPDRDRTARVRRAYRSLLKSRRADAAPTLADLELSGSESAELRADMAVLARPPDVPWLAGARAELERLGLLTPTVDGCWMVHRWTASALAETDSPELRRAHRRAAAYGRWWADLHAADPDYDHADLEEARYHSAAAGDLDQAVAVAAELCTVLHGRSALYQERLVCLETIELIGDDHLQTWFFRHQLGVLDMWQGRYADAERHQRRCLELAVARADPLDEAVSLRELGAIAQLRGDADTARSLYREAIGRCQDRRIREEPAALTVLAASYQQLGGLDLARENSEAWRWSKGALNIADELAESAGPAATERDLARLARALGHEARADQHGLRASEYAAAGEDAHRLVATSALQTGAVRLLHGAPALAADELWQALDAAAGLGDHQLYAQCLQLLGDVLFETGQFAAAAGIYRKFAELADELGDPVRQAIAEQQLGRVAIEHDPADRAGLAEGHFAEAAAIAERLDNRSLVAASGLFRGEAARRRGDAATARRWLLDALMVADTAGAPAVWIAGAIELGSLEARDGRHEAAEEWFEQALRRAERAGNQRAMISCWTALGLLARQHGQDGTAAERLIEALAVAEGGDHRRAAANCRLHLARIADDQGRRAEAETWYTKALGPLDEETDVDLIAEACRRRGRLRLDHQDWTGAVPDLRRALAIYRDHDVPDSAAWCLLLLCRAHRMTGADDEAASAALKAGVLAEDLAPSALRVIGLLAAGEERLEAGDPGGALEWFAAALRSAQEVEALVADCRRALARAALAAGDQAGAATHQQQAVDISRALRDEIAVMHDERALARIHLAAGRRTEAVQCLRRSSQSAAELNDVAAAVACRALLAGGRLSPDSDPAVSTVESRWRDLLWLRRTRWLAGEQPFSAGMPAYLGPSVDQVLREMRSRHSAVAGVPLVVRPHRVRRAAPGP
ncbi:tetratricopeptide repeat protein [Actinoplanes sp. NPDC051411]|uniref:tetratricopeptide repeat protein n=1 Tax=Actinoplanes sp. NPDC051411 TaxID=3155522 RepID=UPI0034475E3A